MFREVPGSLWKYPEGYGTLQNAETEARPSWKVHKVVGRRESDFPWGTSPDARDHGVWPLDAGLRGVSCGNPCWTPPGGQNRLWGDPSPKLRPQASTYIYGGRGSPKDTPENPKASPAKSHAPLILFGLDRSSTDAARIFSL